jgi:hypothetical protein
MKVDRDMMALLKATKKAALPPAETLERIRKSAALRERSAEKAEAATTHGSDIRN